MESNDKANILICDDEPRNILALEALLNDLGQNLVKAASGQEVLRNLHTTDFAVIVLDVRMPELDGLETARLIRQRKKTRHTPIIFLTAHRDDNQLLRGYEAGAVDYLTKPVAPEVLRSKVSVFVNLYQMNLEVRRKGEELREMQQREHERQMEAARREVKAARMRTELEIAQRIQRGLYPVVPPKYPGFEMHAETQPAVEMGGDYYDYFPLADGTLGVVVGDVSGHGMGPALLMSATRAYLRAIARTYSDPAQILFLANNVLVGDVTQGHFVTLFLGRIDPVSRRLTYSSAGHPAGYILNDAGEVSAALASTGLPLGILPDTEFDCGEPAELPPGSSLYLHTDGIMEAINPEGEMFGAARALAIVSQNLKRSPQEIVSEVTAAARAFSGENEPSDDLTALVLKSIP